MIALATGLCILIRNNKLLDIKIGRLAIKRGARSPHFPASAILGVVFFIGLIAVPSLIGPLGGPRLTIFGPLASLIATVVLVVTTFGATIFTVIALHASRRIRTISAHIGRCVALLSVLGALIRRVSTQDCGPRVNGSRTCSLRHRSSRA
jgi:hypothetical protein